MKDFKKMPKMACGGGVKKMQAGGASSDTDFIKALKTGKAKPVEMPSRNFPAKTVTIDGEMSEAKPAATPERSYGGSNIPGVGRVKPAPMPSRGDLQLLKKGGKVKRGKVTKK